MSTPGPRKPETQATSEASGLQQDHRRNHADLLEATRHMAYFNDENGAHEDLWSRTRQMTDHVSQSEESVRQADTDWAYADLNYKAIQAENPERTAPRPRQWILAGGTLALDGVACYFAAETLGGSPSETLAWAVLFLALLGAGEVTLDACRDNHQVLWRWTASVLGAFTVLLGVLRFWFLAVVGVDGLVTAGAGAILFTLATAGFVVIGYRALRLAETAAAWQARRKALSCKKLAARARRRLERLKIKRDGLARAYVGRIRIHLIKDCSATEFVALERAIRSHLLGQEQS